jgi:molybdopterin/thiamine biosynthesis adenylyltransferase
MLTGRELERYERQILFRPIGTDGQERLRQATVAVAGMGALGTVASTMLCRAGVGRLRLIDHDRVELSNLQRQILYDEADVTGGRPKAEIAAEKLRRVNSDIEIESLVVKVEAGNAADLVTGADLIIDAVDNFRAKFALNAAALELGQPLIYGALSGTYGLSLAIIPHETACLGCIYHEEPDADSSETAATAGVIGPTVNTIASLQVAQALKILVGARDEVITDLVQVDLWDCELNLVPAPRKPHCPMCGAAG